MSQAATASNPLTYQEILRSVGAWIDVRGYREVRISGDVGGLVIEGVLGEEDSGDETERLLLDNEHLERFCEASRLNRSPAPTVSPSTRPRLTIVPFKAEPPPSF
jgi:hypothetical protein